LEEFVLVDASGRIQIPQDYLDQIKIGERARVQIEDGTVTLRPEE